MKITEKILAGSKVMNKITGEVFEIVAGVSPGDAAKSIEARPVDESSGSGEIVITDENAICFRVVKFAKPTDNLDAEVRDGALFVNGTPVELGELGEQGKNLILIGTTPLAAVVATKEGVYVYDYIKDRIDKVQCLDETDTITPDRISKDGILFFKTIEEVEEKNADGENIPSIITRIMMYNPWRRTDCLYEICISDEAEAMYTVVPVIGAKHPMFYVNVTTIDGKTRAYTTNNCGAVDYGSEVFAAYRNSLIDASVLFTKAGVLVETPDDNVLFKVDAKELYNAGYTAVCDTNFSEERVFDIWIDTAFLCDAECTKSISLIRKSTGDARGYVYKVA